MLLPRQVGVLLATMKDKAVLGGNKASGDSVESIPPHGLLQGSRGRGRPPSPLGDALGALAGAIWSIVMDANHGNFDYTVHFTSPSHT